MSPPVSVRARHVCMYVCITQTGFRASAPAWTSMLPIHNLFSTHVCVNLVLPRRDRDQDFPADTRGSGGGILLLLPHTWCWHMDTPEQASMPSTCHSMLHHPQRHMHSNNILRRETLLPAANKDAASHAEHCSCGGAQLLATGAAVLPKRCRPGHRDVSRGGIPAN